jgi:glyceraldehyde-3-phosphate dehydrogenase/erythrose-4-phosphate dehydrogenase
MTICVTDGNFWPKWRSAAALTVAPASTAAAPAMRVVLIPFDDRVTSGSVDIGLNHGTMFQLCLDQFSHGIS